MSEAKKLIDRLSEQGTSSPKLQKIISDFALDKSIDKIVDGKTINMKPNKTLKGRVAAELFKAGLQDIVAIGKNQLQLKFF